MPPRFDGAVTTPDASLVTDQTVVPPPTRPRRPVLIELASAVLIVGGITSIVGVFAVQGPLALLVAALNVLTIMVGILVRMGRAWVLAINVVAIALFLEVTAFPSGIAITLAMVDAFVLFALLRHRSWFDWRPPDGEAAA